MVLVFDDDNYYMGPVLAELVRSAGADVTLVTPENMAASFGRFTSEQHQTQTRLLELGINLTLAMNLQSFDGDQATHRCYMHAQHVLRAADGGRNFIIAGHYVDRLVRTTDGWRITHRDLIVTWTEGNRRVVDVGN